MTDYLNGKLDPLETCQMYMWIGLPMELEAQFREEDENLSNADTVTRMSIGTKYMLGYGRVD